MKCGLAQWLVSSASDRNRPLPRWVHRHADRCQPCRDFIRFSGLLDDRARRDAINLLETIEEPPIAGMPDRIPAGARPDATLRPTARRIWIRAAATSAAAALILGAIMIFRPSSPALTPISATSLWEEVSPLNKLPVQGGAIHVWAVEAESPLDLEYENLKKALSSAARIVQGRLDLKIGVNLP